MRLEKRNKYRLTGSVHTLTIKTSSGKVKPLSQQAQDCLKKNREHLTPFGELESTITINPNQYFADCFTFTGFEATLKKIFDDCKIGDWVFVRTDFRLDNYDPEHYQAFTKLNRYLLSSLSIAYKLKNNYLTHDLLTLRQKTQAIKGNRFEAEHYNRAIKSAETENTRERAQSRLELRTVAKEWQSIYYGADVGESNFDLLRMDLTETWFTRLDAALNHLDEIQMIYNENLEQIYHELMQDKIVRVRSVTDFILWFQDFIFTKKQLIDLYERLEPNSRETAAKKATYFKREYGIEFFSKNDAKYAVNEIKRSILEFFAK